MEGYTELPNCQTHSKVHCGSEGEDIIGKLPDGVLHHILSFLSTKEAIRTSILSSRWQYLWTSISNIDLDDTCEHLGSEESSPRCRTGFFDFVERVLLLHDASDIRRFLLRVNGNVSPARVNSWVTAMIRHRVQEMDLLLPFREQVMLPCCLFTCQSIAILKLHMNCDLWVPTNICFSNLKSLRLTWVTFFDDNSAERLFSSCPVLEDLALIFCGWDNIKRITISFPMLKKLTVSLPFPGAYDNILDCEIKFYAANLTSLDFTGNPVVDFLLYNLSSLINASISLVSWGEQEVARRAVKIFNSIRNAECLTIHIDNSTALFFAENFLDFLPNFNSLTDLMMGLESISDYSAKVLMAFLQKSPELGCLFIIKAFKNLDEEDLMLESVPCCFKSRLKRVVFSHFHWDATDIQVLEFLLKNAIVLESMNIAFDNSSVDKEKQKDIKNQLEMLPRGSESCELYFL